MQSWLDSEFERAAATQRRRTYWERVHDLQEIGSEEVFERALEFLKSREARRRRVGADVLGELGFQQHPRPYRERSIPPLKAALRNEADSAALAAIVVALSRLNARSAIAALVKLKDHPSAEVRRALAGELDSCTWDTGEEIPDRRVTATLLALSEDREAMVRDWATYSLAGSDVDTQQVRAALWGRATDRHFDTRIEALRGLARRRDKGVRDVLRATVEKAGPRGFGSWTIDDFVEYARAVGDRDVARTLSSWERVPPPRSRRRRF